ncbi:MAG TPA: glycosyltransferase family A protein [Candidatus Acidoferrum sp.]|jgi:glycosyltransferase involved in cell wall biosynthesis
MKPLISILVDTYNHERYIEQTLTSVVEQGLPAAEMEVVVVDDGSTDRTPEIVAKFAPRVRVVRKKNGGQASAFNAGFAECKGELVAILDGDDWFEKGKIAAVLEALEHNHEVAAVSHAYYEFFEETKELKVCGPAQRTELNLGTPEAARAALDCWHFLPMGALTVRRKLLERIMPIPEALIFSADNPIQVAAMAMRVLVLETPLSYYRRHPDNLYAIDGADGRKVRRKCEMVDLSYSLIAPMLERLGVRKECVSALLDPNWVEVNRFCLRTFGGSPLKTFRTEMMDFRQENKKATVGYLFFKYCVAGAAMLLLPPRKFYQLRDWYAHEEVGRHRERLFRAGEERKKTVPRAGRGTP